MHDGANTAIKLDLEFQKFHDEGFLSECSAVQRSIVTSVGVENIEIITKIFQVEIGVILTMNNLHFGYSQVIGTAMRKPLVSL